MKSFQVQTQNQKLDRLVAEWLKLSRRQARMLISSGKIFVNGRVNRILMKPIAEGATLEVADDAFAAAPPVQTPKLTVLYLDKWLVAVHKPAGLLSETDRIGSPSVQTLLPEILRARGEKQLQLWLVHRLDAGTSGVLLLARKPSVSAALGEAFKQGTIAKTYWALVKGKFTANQTLDAPIQRLQGTKHGVHPEGKPARTIFEIKQSGELLSWVIARPKTGRTHQIRVHLSHLGFPILGDRLYGGQGYSQKGEPIFRPMLHAAKLTFKHPATEEMLTIEAEAPDDFKQLLLSC